MRTFEFVLYHGVGNILKTTATISGNTPFQACGKFCEQMRCISYALREEQPVTQDDKLYSVWSAGCDISGQRIYIKEQIGGF